MNQRFKLWFAQLEARERRVLMAGAIAFHGIGKLAGCKLAKNLFRKGQTRRH